MIWLTTGFIVIAVVAKITAQRSGLVDTDGESRGIEIIKQINRVNDDGTYTYGYEAADGSFKIETRDVLGNVKGMFGYIDNNGELKRVSYSAANGTGFQATDDGSIPSHQLPARRPEFQYARTTPHQIQKIPPRKRVPTTPVYEYEFLLMARLPSAPLQPPMIGCSPEQYDPYSTRRPQIDFSGETTEPTQRPVRILVTKRPLGLVQADSKTSQNVNTNNLIRRQLGARDSQDVLSGGIISRPPPPNYRDSRYNPQIERPDQRETYRNMLLEQNNLKPDYNPIPRNRYYPAVNAVDEGDEEYPEVPAVVPMVNRVLGNTRDTGRARPRYARPPPPPGIIDENAYPPPSLGITGRRAPYRGWGGNQYQRVPPPYDPYTNPIDYDALREEIMNYLIQYIQYRTRGYFNRPYLGYTDPLSGRLPPVIPRDEYDQPRGSPYPQDYYNQRLYRHRFGGIPQPSPPLGPIGQNVGPVPQPFAPPLPVAPPPGLTGYPGYNQPGVPGYGVPGPAASYPFVNPNVQYAESEDASGTTTAATTDKVPAASEALSQFKERIDASDHHDASDTRPPSPGLIRMLLARPGASRSQLSRPTVRSVEIIGTAASENVATTNQPHPTGSSTTTEADPMMASP